MKQLSVSVPQPCKEKWESFTPTKNGGHCLSCQKEVIDFTGWSEQRLIHYFKNGYEGCGRFRQDQLKNYSLPVHPSRSQHWTAVLFLGAATLFANRDGIAQGNSKPVYPTQQRPDSTKKLPVAKQNRTITGTVFDDAGGTVPGTNVLLKGTSIATVTDANGMYEIVVPKSSGNEVIVYSFIGFFTQEINTSNRNVIDVVLKPDIEALNEVIVVGGMIATKRFTPRSIWWKIRHIF